MFLLPRCPSNGALRIVFLVLEAVLFGLFTLCMMCDQYSVIMTGTTQIDRLKGETVETLGLREVFGGASPRFSLQWLLPVDIWFPRSVKHQLLGYVLEEELVLSDDDTDLESFLPSDSGASSAADELVSSLSPPPVVTTETLEGGWSVEKRVPVPDADLVV